METTNSKDATNGAASGRLKRLVMRWFGKEDVEASIQEPEVKPPTMEEWTDHLLALCFAGVIKKLKTGEELTPEQLELRNILERDRGPIYRVRSQIVFISKIDIGYRISDGNRSWFSKDIPDNAVKL